MNTMNQIRLAGIALILLLMVSAAIAQDPVE